MLRTFYRWQAIAALVLLFFWLYGRFACRLEFVLDDYIETEASLSRPLSTAVVDSFTGRLTWSGYRPVSYSMRAGLAHLFGTEQFCGYHSVSLGLHLVNTLLVFHLAGWLFTAPLWAFVAALLFLLLPSHNEAVLYMSANANLLALFFALLTLSAWQHMRAGRKLGWMGLAWVAYLVGVLAYEVILPLPLLLLALEWAAPAASTGRSANEQESGQKQPHRLLLYSGLFGVALVTLGLRTWAMQGQLAQPRADYAVNFAPTQLWQGYQILWGQLFLLHTSPWAHLPLFVNVREWMSPLNLRALASLFLTVGLTGWLLIVGLGQEIHITTRMLRRQVVWSFLWLLFLSLPFAALTGRNPENRYTYIPSLGFALGIAALAAILCRASKWRRVAQVLVSGALLVLVGFYAYVDTSDVAEWERAALHLRTFRQDLPALLPPSPATDAWLFQVGVPGDVGTAYLFTTPAAFQAAMNLLYGWPAARADMGDLQLRERLTSAPIVASQTYLVAYAREAHRTYRIDEALLCSPELACLRYDMAGAGDAPVNSAIYVQLFAEKQRQQPGLSLLFAADDTGQQQLQSCWAFYDVQAVKVDPGAFDNVALAATCQAQAAALQAKLSR